VFFIAEIITPFQGHEPGRDIGITLRPNAAVVGNVRNAMDPMARASAAWPAAPDNIHYAFSFTEEHTNENPSAKAISAAWLGIVH
jgi:hypothetical protein